jgi:hypothetical protein
MNSSTVQSGHVPIAVVRFCLVVKIYLLTSTSHFGPHPPSQTTDIRSPFPESKAAGMWTWWPIFVQCHPDLLSRPRASPVRDQQTQAHIFFLIFNLKVWITESCAVTQCPLDDGYQDFGRMIWILKLDMARSCEMLVCTDMATEWQSPGS